MPQPSGSDQPSAAQQKQQQQQGKHKAKVRHGQSPRVRALTVNACLPLLTIYCCLCLTAGRPSRHAAACAPRTPAAP